MSIFNRYQSRYESAGEEELSLQEYLDLCRRDPTAYASVAFLMHYFKTHELKALNPFGIYCLMAGVASVVWFGLL